MSLNVPVNFDTMRVPQLEQEMRNKELELQKVQSDLERLNSATQDLAQKHQNCMNGLNTAQRQVQDLTRRVNDGTQKLSTAKGEETKAAEAVTKAQDAVNTATQKLQTCTETLNKANGRLNTANEAVNTATESVNSAQGDLNTATAMPNPSDEHIQEEYEENGQKKTRTKTISHAAEREARSNAIQGAQTKLNNAKSELNKAKAEQTAAKTEVNNALLALNRAQTDLTRLLKLLDDARTRYQKAVDATNKAAAELNTLQPTLQLAQNQLQTIQNQLQQIVNEMNKTTGDKTKYAQQIQEANQKLQQTKLDLQKSKDAQRAAELAEAKAAQERRLEMERRLAEERKNKENLEVLKKSVQEEIVANTVLSGAVIENATRNPDGSFTFDMQDADVVAQANATSEDEEAQDRITSQSSIEAQANAQYMATDAIQRAELESAILAIASDPATAATGWEALAAIFPEFKERYLEIVTYMSLSNKWTQGGVPLADSQGLLVDLNKELALAILSGDAQRIESARRLLDQAVAWSYVQTMAQYQKHEAFMHNPPTVVTVGEGGVQGGNTTRVEDPYDDRYSYTKINAHHGAVVFKGDVKVEFDPVLKQTVYIVDGQRYVVDGTVRVVQLVDEDGKLKQELIYNVNTREPEALNNGAMLQQTVYGQNGQPQRDLTLTDSSLYPPQTPGGGNIPANIYSPAYVEHVYNAQGTVQKTNVVQMGPVYTSSQVAESLQRVNQFLIMMGNDLNHSTGEQALYMPGWFQVYQEGLNLMVDPTTGAVAVNNGTGYMMVQQGRDPFLIDLHKLEKATDLKITPQTMNAGNYEALLAEAYKINPYLGEQLAYQFSTLMLLNYGTGKESYDRALANVPQNLTDGQIRSALGLGPNDPLPPVDVARRMIAQRNYLTAFTSAFQVGTVNYISNDTQRRMTEASERFFVQDVNGVPTLCERDGSPEGYRIIGPVAKNGNAQMAANDAVAKETVKYHGLDPRWFNVGMQASFISLAASGQMDAETAKRIAQSAWFGAAMTEKAFKDYAAVGNGLTAIGVANQTTSAALGLDRVAVHTAESMWWHLTGQQGEPPKDYLEIGNSLNQNIGQWTDELQKMMVAAGWSPEDPNNPTGSQWRRHYDANGNPEVPPNSEAFMASFAKIYGFDIASGAPVDVPGGAIFSNYQANYTAMVDKIPTLQAHERGLKTVTNTMAIGVGLINPWAGMAASALLNSAYMAGDVVNAARGARDWKDVNFLNYGLEMASLPIGMLTGGLGSAIQQAILKRAGSGILQQILATTAKGMMTGGIPNVLTELFVDSLQGKNSEGGSLLSTFLLGTASDIAFDALFDQFQQKIQKVRDAQTLLQNKSELSDADFQQLMSVGMAQELVVPGSNQRIYYTSDGKAWVRTLKGWVEVSDPRAKGLVDIQNLPTGVKPLTGAQREAALAKIAGGGTINFAQGNIGDCSVISAMASIYKVDPEIILNMITPLSDGSFLFTLPPRMMPDGTLAPSRSTIITAADLDRVSGSQTIRTPGTNDTSSLHGVKTDTPALAIAERGYLRIFRLDDPKANKLTLDFPGTSPEAVYSQLLPNRPITTTPVGSKFDSFVFSELNDGLTVVSAATRPVDSYDRSKVTFLPGSGNAGEKIFYVNSDPNHTPIYITHAYIVIGESNGMVTLQNPHNSNEIITLPYEVFKIAFGQMYSVRY